MEAGLLSLLISTQNFKSPQTSGGIQVASCTVADLFADMIPGSAIAGKLKIPEYQRPYVWQHKEVMQLLEDLREYFDRRNGASPLYYVGSIVLHQHEGHLNIIDGQQRLTTLAILNTVLNFNQDVDIYYNHPISLKNIQNNYALLKNTIDDQGGFANFDLHQINITLIVTDNEDDAYTFFETQNTGGVRLTGVDIIKAHHLRALATEVSRSEYATIWEDQKEIDKVISYLLKARKWNILNWKDIPSYRNRKDTKSLIIKEFSQQTLAAGNTAFRFIAFDPCTNEPVGLNDNSHFAIRQPLANGQNFIIYLKSFAGIHEQLFMNRSFDEVSLVFYEFNNDVIDQVPGTAYIKDLYYTALLCYVSRFGINDITEAAFWLFRYTYSIRVSNEKTVKESSIPAFLKASHYLLDHILTSFTHLQLVKKLRSFSYKVNSENCEAKNVKGKFIERVQSYFSFDCFEQDDNDKRIIPEYDKLLQKAIDVKLRTKR